MKKIVLLLTMSFLLAACGTTQDNTAPENPDNSNATNGSGSGEDSSNQVETDKSDSKKELIDKIKEEDKVELAGTLEYKEDAFVFIVENNQEQDAEVVFSSGQEYDYLVYDADGKMVKQLSEGMMYTQAIKEDILAPGETFTYSASYAEVAFGLSAGEYTIEFIFADQNFQASAKETFNVE
jgi:TolA-binding protein